MEQIAQQNLGSADAAFASVVDQLKLNDQGLVPAVAQDVKSGEVLMLAWMNAESIRHTFETGYATYWSRSRNELWKKGETSGHLQKLMDFRVDCDGDTILLLVEQTGAACHTNRKNCFFRAPRDGKLTTLFEPI